VLVFLIRILFARSRQKRASLSDGLEEYPIVRKRFLAVMCAGLLAIAGSAIPASAAEIPSASAAFSCSASASLTRNGATVFSTERTFHSAKDVSAQYSRTYVYDGDTYTASASVSCVR
jgi:hypothetical protein